MRAIVTDSRGNRTIFDDPGDVRNAAFWSFFWTIWKPVSWDAFALRRKTGWKPEGESGVRR